MKDVWLMFGLLCSIAFPAFSEGNMVTAHIEGMTCPSCAASVEREMKQLPEVDHVTVSLRKGTATMTVKENMQTTKPRIQKAVEDAGFKLRSVDGLSEP